MTKPEEMREMKKEGEMQQQTQMEVTRKRIFHGSRDKTSRGE